MGEELKKSLFLDKETGWETVDEEEKRQINQ